METIIKKRWLYKVTDWNDDSFYVDEKGNQVDYSDAKEYIATDIEAEIEADRRADLWEIKYDALVARITRCSQGFI